jgi:hypothetical protein
MLIKILSGKAPDFSYFCRDFDVSATDETCAGYLDKKHQAQPSLQIKSNIELNGIYFTGE